MADITSYLTPARAARAEFTDRRSRFIGSVQPVASEQEAAAFLGKVRAEFPDARHHVYAYRVLEPGSGVAVKRYSDDGEPQGTGGLPVLAVLEKKEIFNAALVVTRYFGGILLGAPGLVRAYGKAASLAVSEAGFLTVERCREIRIEVDYALYGKVQKCLEGFRCIIKPPVFGADVTLTVTVPSSDAGRLQKSITDLTSAVCRLSLGQESFQYID